MSTYDPLTSSQIALLKEIESSPIVMTLSEQSQSAKGKDLSYLIRTGLVTVEIEHTAQDSNQSTNRFSRTKKPYP